MNAIEKLFPVSQQERSFQLKVRRDAGTLRPAGCSRNLLNVKMRPPRHPSGLDQKPVCMPQLRVHLPIGAYYRLSTILDHGTFKELNPDLASNDVLHFPDYQESWPLLRSKRA